MPPAPSAFCRSARVARALSPRLRVLGAVSVALAATLAAATSCGPPPKSATWPPPDARRDFVRSARAIHVTRSPDGSRVGDLSLEGVRTSEKSTCSGCFDDAAANQIAGLERAARETATVAAAAETVSTDVGARGPAGAAHDVTSGALKVAAALDAVVEIDRILSTRTTRRTLRAYVHGTADGAKERGAIACAHELREPPVAASTARMTCLIVWTSPPGSATTEAGDGTSTWTVRADAAAPLGTKPHMNGTVTRDGKELLSFGTFSTWEVEPGTLFYAPEGGYAGYAEIGWGDGPAVLSEIRVDDRATAERRAIVEVVAPLLAAFPWPQPPRSAE